MNEILIPILVAVVSVVLTALVTIKFGYPDFPVGLEL